ncbi:unnamed protein product [Blepharisma stoltei]|uniref:Uncharacterized protein n=1 Tax=Blepharisma stoltei TaxID=1481888 RepID=A0AAU9IDS3_9CILI|nr:unnamed protein product [Blepharisma stoltei]
MAESLETQIGDADDLEDRLSVMESVVEQMKATFITRAQLEVLLNQYIILEDSILLGLQSLAKTAEDPSVQQQITACAEKFNEYGSDYQDTWTEEFWSIYELIREGYQKSGKKKTGVEIANQIADVQEIALTLNRISRGNTVEGAGKKVLEEVDELSKKYKSSTLIVPEREEEPKQQKKCSSKCLVM